MKRKKPSKTQRKMLAWKAIRARAGSDRRGVKALLPRSEGLEETTEMTRKKWNRLRRQRPELFEGLPHPYSRVKPLGWERLNRLAKFQDNVNAKSLLTASKRETIERLTAWHVTRKLEQ